MKLRLKQIERDSKLSPRTKTDVEIAKGYADCFDQLPPIVVFKIPDKSNYLLVDGWHRYRAAEILKLEEIEVEARFGTLEQAEEYALLANLKHGLPLTRKERQGVIEKFLKLHFERTNNWISVDLGVHQDTVKRIRRKLEERLQIRIVKIFIGKDGREYPRTIERPKKEIQETEKAEEAEADSDEEEKQKIDEEENQEISSDESKTPPIPTLGVYELNKVHQVDCLEGFMGLPEASIDLVFADPPYNLSKNYGEGFKDKKEESEYLSWCVHWFWGAYRVLKPGGAFYLMHYPEVAAQWKQQLDGLFTFQRWLSWVYPSNTGQTNDNWRRSHRTILYYIRGNKPAFFEGEADLQPYKNPNDKRVAHLGKEGTTPYDWWEYNLVKNVSESKTSWPNQLPLDLIKRIIVTSCSPDGIVCDPFIGSGTTAEAAIEANRSWIGFDLQSKACAITMKRVSIE